MSYKTIDDYINNQDQNVIPLLQEIRNVIREVAPQATEKIAWQMPTFWQKENIIHFAANKNHLGIYPGGEATTFFAEKLADYKTSKGAVQIPYTKPLPKELIVEIVKWRLEQVNNQ